MTSQDSQFWVTNPQDLNLLKFWPCKNASAASNANSFTVLTFYVAVIGSIITKSYTPLYFGVLVTAGIAVFYYLYYKPEGFERMHNLVYPTDYNPGLATQDLRPPTQNNPFMNVNVTDYGKPQEYKNYNRYKETIYPTPETENIRNEVQDDFTRGLFQNPSGKLFDRQNSQREYISQPVGEVPSRQNEFAQWLYGKEYVGKSGSIYMRYGMTHTPDSLVNTGFNSSEPSNFGIKQKYV